MSRDASSVIERNRQRSLFAAKIQQETALTNGIKNVIILRYLTHYQMLHKYMMIMIIAGQYIYKLEEGKLLQRIKKSM